LLKHEAKAATDTTTKPGFPIHFSAQGEEAFEASTNSQLAPIPEKKYGSLLELQHLKTKPQVFPTTI